MVYRHALVTRITHAVFALSFLALGISGAQMYLHAHWLHVNVARLHQYCGLAMLSSGVVYVAYGILSGDLGRLIFGARDVAGLWPMIAHYLRLRREPPAFDSYNPLQKLAYTTIVLMIGPLLAASGLALWRHAPLLRPFASLFGGHAAQFWHVGFALELILFFFGHMLMVATAGLRNNVRAMVTGWYAPQKTVRTANGF